MATRYIFPRNLGVAPELSNHMIFTTREIVGAKGGATKGTGTGSQPAFGGNLGEVILPIPSGLNIAYAQGWDQAQIGAAQQMSASNMGETLGGLMSGAINKDLGNVVNAAWEGLTSTKNAITGIMSEGGGEGYQKTAGAGFAPEATGFLMTAPGMQSVAQASQFTMGKRALDQTMISYSGPGFRNFSFNFSFKPMNQEETNIVTGLINHFKIYSAPNQLQPDFTRIYELPAVFKIQFYYGSQEHTHIGKIGHCALTNIGVTYGGDKFSTFEGTHAPVQVDITLAFKEMELLNRQLLETESEYDFLGGGGGSLARANTDLAGST